jgi:hypothetical protein
MQSAKPKSANVVGRMHAANQALDAIGAFLRKMPEGVIDRNRNH